MGLFPPITPLEARRARVLLGWSQVEAAKRASITGKQVSDAELRRGSDYALGRLKAAYEAAGAEFAKGDQAPVLLRRSVPSSATIPTDDLNAINDE